MGLRPPLKLGCASPPSSHTSWMGSSSSFSAPLAPFVVTGGDGGKWWLYRMVMYRRLMDNRSICSSPSMFNMPRSPSSKRAMDMMAMEDMLRHHLVLDSHTLRRRPRWHAAHRSTPYSRVGRRASSAYAMCKREFFVY